MRTETAKITKLSAKHSFYGSEMIDNTYNDFSQYETDRIVNRQQTVHPSEEGNGGNAKLTLHVNSDTTEYTPKGPNKTVTITSGGGPGGPMDDYPTAGSSNAVKSFGIKKAIDDHANLKNNPHKVTKAQIGLGNVDNTSDMKKPVSIATATELTKLDNKIPSIQTIEL